MDFKEIRKKEPKIEALQLTEKLIEMLKMCIEGRMQICPITNEYANYARLPSGERICFVTKFKGTQSETLIFLECYFEHGGFVHNYIRISVNDWIVKTNNEMFICSDKLFKKEYEEK